MKESIQTTRFENGLTSAVARVVIRATFGIEASRPAKDTYETLLAGGRYTARE